MESGRILIVHENIERLRKLREILSREGFDIFSAPDFKTAAKMCEHLKMDFIISNPLYFSFYPKYLNDDKINDIKDKNDN